MADVSRSVTAAALLLLAAPLAGQSDEFGAEGVNVVRIENEAKLRVPDDVREAVWKWLQTRYREPGFLDRAGHAFHATFGDEVFVDRYFDSPELQLLQADSGLRHRSRVIRDGSAMAKDGRQLVQLKLNRHDGTGLERAEIKFKVVPRQGIDPADEPAVLDLVGKARGDLATRLLELRLDPSRLRNLVTIEQVRRRVYLADQHGAFATITLDDVRCDGWWQQVRFTEIELELNEIRFTEADATLRATMNAINAAIQADLQQVFPSIVQDQTPKYTKVFSVLEAGMPPLLSLRLLLRLGFTPVGLVFAGGAAVATAVVLLVAGWRRRRRRAAPGAPVASGN